MTYPVFDEPLIIHFEIDTAEEDWQEFYSGELDRLYELVKNNPGRISIHFSYFFNEYKGPYQEGEKFQIETMIERFMDRAKPLLDLESDYTRSLVREVFYFKWYHFFHPQCLLGFLALWLGKHYTMGRRKGYITLTEPKQRD